MATVAVPLDIAGARVDPTNTPEYVYIAGTNFPSDGYAFPQSSAKAIYLKIGAELYGNSGNWTFEVYWYSRSGSTTNSVQWTAALAAITPGDAQSVETKPFATSQNTTTTVNGTAKGLTITQITISNLDGVNAGDTVWIKLTRTDTSMTGDAIAARAMVSYSDGNSGTAGSGDFVGPASATDTAFVRFNSTTGKLGQNSVVLCDNSGNMTGIASLNAGFIMPGLVRLTSTFTSSGNALQDITGSSITVPAAGTYAFEYYLNNANSSTTGACLFAVNATGGTITNYSVLVTNPATTTTVTFGAGTNNNTALSSATRTATTSLPTTIRGSFTCTTSGTCIARLSMSANTIVVAIGSWGRLTRIA